MKGYKNHMDNITADPALQGKILDRMRLAQEAPPQMQRRMVFRYAGFAACAAVLLLAVWVLPGILSTPTLPNGSNGSNGSDNGFVGSEIPTDPYVAVAPNDPEAPVSIDFEIHALVFNTAESMMSASRMLRPGYFDYDITPEQLSIIFPGLYAILTAEEDAGSLSFGAAAFYRPNGELEFASVGESVITHDRQVLWMDLQVGVGDIPESTMLLYGDGDKTISQVHGVDVTAFVHISPWDDVFLRADFMLDGISYRVTLSGYDLETGQQRITEIVNWLIVTGPANLSVLADPVIPELRNDLLTLDQARQDPDFGVFLPVNIPEGFVFSSASRLLDTRVNYLMVFFMHDVPWQFRHSLRWMVATPTEHDLRNVVSVNDRQKFDVSLYPIPWADSVPSEYFYYFQSPVFLASEISLDTIQARTRWVDTDLGDAPEWRTDQFSVMFDNVVVQISANGLSAEQIWEMLNAML